MCGLGCCWPSTGCSRSWHDAALTSLASSSLEESPAFGLHEKKKEKKIEPTNHLLVTSLITLSKLTFGLPINLYSPYCKDSLSCGIEAPSSSWDSSLASCLVSDWEIWVDKYREMFVFETERVFLPLLFFFFPIYAYLLDCTVGPLSPEPPAAWFLLHFFLHPSLLCRLGGEKQSQYLATCCWKKNKQKENTGFKNVYREAVCVHRTYAKALPLVNSSEMPADSESTEQPVSNYNIWKRTDTQTTDVSAMLNCDINAPTYRFPILTTRLGLSIIAGFSANSL